MATTYYVKSLRLVTPEAAIRFGLPATDAPVFVSPLVQKPTGCLESGCSTIYTPLAYQSGLVTTAQHYHPTDGGIYFNIAYSLAEAAKTCACPWGFVAFLELFGQYRRFRSRGRRCGRSEAVRTVAIAAYEKRDRISSLTILTEGVLRERRLSADLERGTLLPVRDVMHQETGALRFSVRDGAVTFMID